MKKFRTVVVDDEPLARELLIDMLARHPEIELVGDYENGDQAVIGIRETAPDLLFLDIQMPGKDGFDVLQELEADRLPAVVFVTAYDEFAIRAFDVSALDYLLKPFDPPRLRRAIDRATSHLGQRSSEAEMRRVLRFLEEMRFREKRQQRLPITVGERTYLQDVDEIDWIEADGRYMKVHVGDQVHAIRETMQNLEEYLDSARFVRVSRSALVNVDRIREIQPWFNSAHVLIMRNGDQVTTTRGHRESVQRLLGREPR